MALLSSATIETNSSAWNLTKLRLQSSLPSAAGVGTVRRLSQLVQNGLAVSPAVGLATVAAVT